MSAVVEVEATVRKCIEKKIERLDNPHRDTDVLCYLYHEKEMSQNEVAEKLGISQQTVGRRLDKAGLETRDARVERATFTPANNSGHESWTVNDPDGSTTVGVHRLLAIADGADPHEVFEDGNHVHHRTGIPWLNIKNGVEVLTAEEHSAVHRDDEWTEEGGIPVMGAN